MPACTDCNPPPIGHFIAAKPSYELSTNLLILICAYPPSLEEIQHFPWLLIGFEIQHCFESEDGDLSWNNGLVIGFNSTEHEVTHSGDETIDQFNLFDDFINGDLKISSLA